MRTALIGLSLTVIFAVPCHAGGLYLYEVNATEIGLAGAGWAARADDATTAFTNPAGMTRIEDRQFEAMLAPVYVQIELEPDANTTVQGSDDDGNQLLPGASFNYVSRIDDKSAWGLSFGGLTGFGADYGSEFVGRYYAYEVELGAVALQPSYARRISDRVSIGAGVGLVYGFLTEKLAINNPGPGFGDGQFEVDDEDTSVMFNISGLFEVSDDTRFGIQYLSETELEFRTDGEAQNVGPVIQAILDRIGAQGLLPLDLELTLPQSLIVSGFHRLNERWEIFGNVGWQEWSRFGKVGVSFDDPNTNDITADRNYEDTVHAALGFRYRPGGNWTWTAGTAFDTEMVDDENRTIDLPLGDTWRFGFGGTYAANDDMDLRFGYGLVWMGDLPVDQNRGPLSGRVSGEFTDTAVHFFAFAINKRF